MDTTFHHLSGYHPRLNLPLILLWGVGSAALVVLMSCLCRRVGAETVESAVRCGGVEAEGITGPNSFPIATS